MIEAKWREFCLACFGDMSEQQYIDLRRTFYGGASALFFVFMSIMGPGGGEPTAEELAKVTQIHNELNAFNEAVKAGKA